MLELGGLPLWQVVALFLVSAAVIAVLGTRMVDTTSEIARRTGIGQAIIGAVFVGIATSLSGTILSFYTAAQNHPQLSVANSVGGIAAQTAFLAVADILLRRANLEHASASLANLAQGALLIILLAMPLAAMAGPDVTWLGIHPLTPLLVVVYITGLRVVGAIKESPMWHPKLTRHTQHDSRETGNRSPASTPMLFVSFALNACLLIIAGLVVAESGIAIAAKTGLSETVVGALFTAVSTSLPELVTVIAAVRAGALNLAVGDIIGGNSFDILFLAGSDTFYRAGSIYHTMNSQHVLIIAVSMMMTGTLLMGMLARENPGIARIGTESVILLLLYAGLVALMLV